MGSPALWTRSTTSSAWPSLWRVTGTSAAPCWSALDSRLVSTWAIRSASTSAAPSRRRRREAQQVRNSPRGALGGAPEQLQAGGLVPLPALQEEREGRGEADGAQGGARGSRDDAHELLRRLRAAHRLGAQPVQL